MWFKVSKKKCEMMEVLGDFLSLTAISSFIHPYKSARRVVAIAGANKNWNINHREHIFSYEFFLVNAACNVKICNNDKSFFWLAGEGEKRRKKEYDCGNTTCMLHISLWVDPSYLISIFCLLCVCRTQNIMCI